MEKNELHFYSSWRHDFLLDLCLDIGKIFGGYSSSLPTATNLMPDYQIVNKLKVLMDSSRLSLVSKSIPLGWESALKHVFKARLWTSV